MQGKECKCECLDCEHRGRYAQIKSDGGKCGDYELSGSCQKDYGRMIFQMKNVKQKSHLTKACQMAFYLRQGQCLSIFKHYDKIK